MKQLLMITLLAVAVVIIAPGQTDRGSVNPHVIDTHNSHLAACDKLLSRSTVLLVPPPTTSLRGSSSSSSSLWRANDPLRGCSSEPVRQTSLVSGWSDLQLT